MGKGGGGGTTNTVSTPWEGQQPYLQDVFERSHQMMMSGEFAPAYYPGQTVAGQSPYTLNAYGIVNGQAGSGDNAYGSMGNALNTTNNVMQNAITGNQGLTNLNRVGDTNAGNTGLQALNKMTNAVNPYSQQLLNQAIGQQTSQLNGNFSQAGRYGSGAHENAVADAATNLTNNFYADAYDKQMQAANSASQAYNTGVGNNIAAMNDAAGVYNNALQAQNQAALNAKDLYNQRYTDAQWLSDIGANQENYNQAKIDADIDRYNYNAQRPLTALSNYNQLIQGTYGGTTTSTGKTGYTGSALGSAVGGATAAASLASALGGSDGLLSYFQ